MKKHFLILMLMALLPLSGFAAQLSKIVVKNSYYGVQPVAGNITVYNEANAEVNPLDYDVVGWFSDAACETAFELTAIAEANATTKYYVKVTGKNGYTGTVIGSAEVAPMPLIVTANAAEKEYGTVADPAFTLSKVAKTTDLETDVKATFGTYITLGREPGEEQGTYNFTASLAASQSNYTIGSVSTTSKFTITAKSFRDVALDETHPATVTITMSETVQYNGQAQTPAIVVKDIAKNQVLTVGTDYEVVWANNTNAQSKDHATLAPKATITGKGNYAASDIVKKFTITQAPLIVIPKAEKVYDGDADIENVGYDYVGWLTAGVPAVDVTGTPVASADVTKYAGEYTLSVSDLTKFESANYYFLAEDGVYKITKKDFRVKANNQTIDYGAALNQEKGDDKAWTYAVAPLADDVDLMDQFVMITAEGTSLVPGLKGDAAIDAIAEAVGGTAEEKAARKVAYKKLRDSYNLATVTEGTPNDLGTLTYTKANLTIALKESVYTLKKKYDGQNVTAPTIAEGGVYVIGEKNTGDVDITGLTVAVTDNAAAAGPYTLTLSGAVFDETKYNVTYVPSTFTIEPRPITVTLDPQVFVKGTVPTIDQTLFTVAEASETTGMGLATGDKASEIFKLDFHKTGGAYDVITFNGAGEIQNDANTYANALVVADFATAEVTSKYNNYAITCTGGSVNDSKPIKTAAAAGATVSFTTRALQAEKWNPLVLPFDVTVQALSEAFGYAVIDVLNNEKGDDGNVYFKLKVSGTINANTPFLIYPSDSKNNLNQVVFEGVNVVAVTGEENVSVADAGGNKFWGTYKSTPIWGQSKRYMSKGTWYDARNYTEASPANIKPLRGYLELPEASAARAIIFIEEADGTTTAIKAVTGDKIGSDIKADGWYTIGGMKLQGAPTQKGIYINNGKKVVVK